MQLEQRVEALEAECRHFHRQLRMLIIQLTKDGHFIQNHEFELRKCEKQRNENDCR